MRGKSIRSIAAVICTALLVSALVPAVATAQMAPRGGWTNAEGHSPFVSVVSQVKDAVVNISAERKVEGGRYHNFPPIFEDWFGPDDQPSTQTSLGSGFIFRPDGYIITNNHVIDDATDITVRLSDKMELPAELVGSDPATDLAILRIRANHDLPYVPMGDSDSLLVGDWVIAVGNPFPAQGLDRTVTVGVISALGRSSLNFGSETPTYQNYIQTDASINPGNSGGPLLSLSGRVVGINAAIASPTGSNVGIGFAIPVNFAKSIIPDLLATGTVSRGWLGIRPRSLTWDDVEAEGLQSADGVIVDQVIENTPAEDAELRVGDVIVAIDGKEIKDAPHFMQLIWQARAGATIDLDVIRRGRPQTIQVTLGDRNAEFASASERPRAPQRRVETLWLGLDVSTATAEVCEEMGSEFNRGVIVTDIDRNGPAWEKGIRVGMIIAEVDHEPIRNEDDYREVVASLTGERRAVSLMVYDQRGQTGYIAVRPERRE